MRIGFEFRETTIITGSTWRRTLGLISRACVRSVTLTPTVDTMGTTNEIFGVSVRLSWFLVCVAVFCFYSIWCFQRIQLSMIMNYSMDYELDYLKRSHYEMAISLRGRLSIYYGWARLFMQFSLWSLSPLEKIDKSNAKTARRVQCAAGSSRSDNSAIKWIIDRIIE